MFRLFLLGASVCYGLVACGSLPEQARLEFTAPATNEEFVRLSENERRLSPQERERLRSITTERFQKSLQLRVWPLEIESAPHEVGYGGDKGDKAYVVQEDQITVLDQDLGPTPLEGGNEGIFDLRPLSSHSGLLLGRAPRGIALWTLHPPYESLRIETTQTRLNNTRIYDAQPLLESGRMAIAHENNRISLWSIRSGRQIADYSIPSFVPRVLAKSATRSSMHFGTSSGDIVHMPLERRAEPQFMYRHFGPVLDILVDETHNLIVSTAKDGAVIGWSRNEAKEKFRFSFSTPVYEVTRLGGTSLVVLTPIKGRPMVVDLATGERTGWLRRRGTDQIGAIEVTHDAQIAMVPVGTHKVSLISLPDFRSRGTLRAPDDGNIVGAALGRETGAVFLADSRGTLWRFDLGATGTPTRILESDGITAIGLSDAETELVVGFVDGSAATFLVPKGRIEPLRLRKGDLK